MRRAWVFGGMVFLLATSLPATTVSGCLLDSSSTACYTSGMFSFADSLDWGAAVNLAGTGQSGFGAAYQGGSNPHNVTISPWNARSVGNINIYASLATGSGGMPVLTRADNTYWGYGQIGQNFVYESMDTVTSPQHLITFAGHFNANPTNLDPTQVGEHLLGNISSTAPLVLDFDHNVQRIGFKIGSNSTSSNTNFAATIVAYNGSTVLHTYQINVGGGGGICDPLRVASGTPNTTPPVPCNDAAFIGLDAGTQRFTSIQVFTSNSGGFYINGLQFSADVPEPQMTLLLGGGLAGLWLFAVARRRFAARR